MATVSFKDLCLDAHDAIRVGRFWEASVGGELTVMDNGNAVLRGEPLHALWINKVPEPRTVKNRVHLDLWADDVVPLLNAGAGVVAEHGRWSVLADPEGNEMCAFPHPNEADPPADGTPAQVFALCVDSDDPVALAAWWHEQLGGELGPGPDGQPRWLHGADGLGDVIMKFVPVDDERVVKNRCHWDVIGDVGELTVAGASVVRPHDDDISWTIMADPEGNEFCAFDPD